MGDEDLYMSIDIQDATYDETKNLYDTILPLMLYVYYSVFFGGIVVGGIGIVIWRMTK